MKRSLRFMLVVLAGAAIVALPFRWARAQQPDTVDVPEGFETLNIAIDGDTTETGDPVNPLRVYRLKRGGYYLLNGSIQGVKGAPIRIIAEEGDGPRPLIIPAVGETGEASRAFRPRGDGLWKGLYITGIDNLGNQAQKNMFRLEKTGGRYIVDDCFLDYDAQSFFRMNSEEQKLYVTNTIMRNSFLLADPGNGRFIDTRGNTQDTIFVQNCTLYRNSADPLRSGDGIIKNLIFDHVTMYEVAGDFGEFESGRAVYCQITNNLYVDFGFEGHVLGDTTSDAMVLIDSLAAPELASEEERVYIIKNNVYGWTPEVKNWLDSKDSLETYPFIEPEALKYLQMFPNMMAENNIEEYPVFSDPPDPQEVVTYAEYRFSTNYSNENNPDLAADRNGRGALSEHPETVGPAPDEYDFDYSTSSQAYTHAEGGFPVGDLNWFPDKKAEWEEWVKTGVATNKRPEVPTNFGLEQNYPNPFNASTVIVYRIRERSPVQLFVINANGQVVRELVHIDAQEPGSYSVTWDGLDDLGRPVSSGVYFYQLKAAGQVQTRKMLYLK